MLVLLSQVTELWQFYCVWIGIGIAASSTLYEACFAVLTRAMGPHARKAITLVTLVAGFAGTLSFPSAHVLSGVIGWRGAVLVFAGAIVTVALPLIWTGCRHAEKLGAAHAPAASRKASHAMWVTRTAVFWLLALAFLMTALEHGVVITHLLPILEDRGVHKEAAVLAAAMIGPMQVAGRLAMMAAERHVSTLVIAMACTAALGVAAACLLGTAVLPNLVVGFVICQGVGVGVTSIIRPVVIAELMGRKDFGVVSGLLAVPFVGGYAAAPTVAALVWAVGGYDLVLVLSIMAPIIGLTAMLAAWRMRAPDRTSG